VWCDGHLCLFVLPTEERWETRVSSGAADHRRTRLPTR